MMEKIDEKKLMRKNWCEKTMEKMMQEMQKGPKKNE